MKMTVFGHVLVLSCYDHALHKFAIDNNVANVIRLQPNQRIAYQEPEKGLRVIFTA